MTDRLFALAAAAVLATAPAVAAKAPEALVVLDKGGEFRIELFPADAPRHVDNFVKLASRGFYDGQRFHRVVPKFVVQIGDPKSRTLPLNHPEMGTGGPGYTIAAEFNRREFVRGVVGMARGPDPNSAGSQIFVMLGDDRSLDGQYTAFGRVVRGMDVVDRIRVGDRVKSVRIVAK